jgi:hypothetical protein
MEGVVDSRWYGVPLCLFLFGTVTACNQVVAAGVSPSFSSMAFVKLCGHDLVVIRYQLETGCLVVSMVSEMGHLRE